MINTAEPRSANFLEKENDVFSKQAFTMGKSWIKMGFSNISNFSTKWFKKYFQIKFDGVFLIMEILSNLKKRK